MYYYNGVQGFINYALSILVETVLDVYARGVRIKKVINPNVVTMHLLQKRFMEKYLYWYVHREVYTLHYTIVERMVE